jgi:DNA mismatch repair ATPase MutS
MYRYEVEVEQGVLPDKFLKNRDKCHITADTKTSTRTSSGKGVIRFQTPEIESLVLKYEDTIQLVRDAMYPFTAGLFSEFRKLGNVYQDSINKIAELDVFQSMAIASRDEEKGSMCVPRFVEAVRFNKLSWVYYSLWYGNY